MRAINPNSANSQVLWGLSNILRRRGISLEIGIRKVYGSTNPPSAAGSGINRTVEVSEPARAELSRLYNKHEGQKNGPKFFAADVGLRCAVN
jgi:hypothetical protein